MPLPPPKQAKPIVASVEWAAEKTTVEVIPVDCDDSSKKTSPPSSPARAHGLSENPQPPIPPSQKTKPSHTTVVSEKEVDGITENVKDPISNVQCETSNSPVTGQDSRELFEEENHSISKSAEDLHQKQPRPLVPPKKKPEIPEKPGTQHGSDKRGETPDATLLPEESLERESPKNEIPSLIVSLSQLDDGLSASICGLDEENKTKAEEKSVDSGQHSDDEDSDGSRSGNTLAVSTSAMRGSHAGLDAMDSSEEDIHSLSYSDMFCTSASKSEFQRDVDPCLRSEPDAKCNTSTKAKSASFGDLLSDCAVCIEVNQHVGAVAGKDSMYCHDVRKLEAEISLEMEKTTDLLNRASQRDADGDGDGNDIPENLLAKAMVKLKKAEYVLREAKKLKSARKSTHRKSW